MGAGHEMSEAGLKRFFQDVWLMEEENDSVNFKMGGVESR